MKTELKLPLRRTKARTAKVSFRIEEEHKEFLDQLKRDGVDVAEMHREAVVSMIEAIKKNGYKFGKAS